MKEASRKPSAEVLRERRQRATQKVPNLSEILRGTLRRRYVRCGKAGCHCARGRGHGPFVYLSVTLGVGRTQQLTIAPEDISLARRYVANYVRIHQILETVSAINRELFRHRLLSEPALTGRRRRSGSGRKHG